MIVLDQATKLWARETFRIGEAPGYPWPGVFEFTLTYNTGIAFGMLQGGGLFVAPIAVGIAGYVSYLSLYTKSEPNWRHVVWGLLAAGALGNLYDRIVDGKVTDMFWFRLIDFPVFNVADACITVSATALVVSTLFGHRKESETPDAKAAEGPTPAVNETGSASRE